MPEEEEYNPMLELIKIPFSETLGSVHIIRALATTLLENQIQIIALLTAKPEKQVRADVLEKLDKELKKIIDTSIKTV